MPMMLAPAQAVKTAAADVRAGFGCLPQPKRAKTTLADAYDARLRRRKATTCEWKWSEGIFVTNATAFTSYRYVDPVATI